MTRPERRVAETVRRWPRLAAGCAAVGVGTTLSACEGSQSALEPSGPIARDINSLWWTMFWGGTAICALVVILIVVALIQRGHSRPGFRHTRFIVAGGIVLPVTTLSVLLPFGAFVGAGAAPNHEGITIHVTGYQWWWNFDYEFGDGSSGFTTANEFSIPVGEPVQLVLESEDVIHSFWLPRLAGKIDLIPGHTNRMTLEADEPGEFRGQCAEFCGLAHAMMAFHAEALTPEAFTDWAETQRVSAQGELELTGGALLFHQTGCALCHTVRGHGAWGAEGPDLTHVGSRKTIAAGTLENTPENIARWIARNNEIKPGNRMPEYPDLDEAVRLQLGNYLTSLK